MADISDIGRTDNVKIVGADEAYAVDVELIDGKQKLLTDATVTVEQVFGQDNLADNWIYIGVADDSTGVGSAGDTIRIQIAAGDDATRYPAIDVTTTVQASDVADSHPEIALRDRIVSDLNANGTFAALWKARAIKDNGIVHISSRLFGEMGERPNADDFTVTVTGTTVITRAFNNVIRRGKATSLTRDSRDPRIGILGISGEVAVTPGSVGSLFIENAKNGGSADMTVSGTVGSPVLFTIGTDADEDIFIREMRFYGAGNGIQFGKFLNKNSPLTDGIVVSIQSDETTITLPEIKTTEDFQSKFALGQIGFQLFQASGQDNFLATFILDTPFPLRKTGTFSVDDYIEVKIQDDCTSPSQLEFLAFGFKREAL